MSLFDYLRIWMAAKLLDMAGLIIPAGHTTDLARHYIMRACNRLSDAIDEDED